MEILQKVKTKDGIGTIVAINVPFNGLYFSFHTATCTVWYGVNSQSDWLSKQYSLREIEALNILPI